MIKLRNRTSTTSVIASDQNLSLPISTQLIVAIATQCLPAEVCIV